MKFMPKYCKAPGCSQAASGYSIYCDHHKQAQRRHGHAAQAGVTVHELRPFVALVDARKAKNPGNPTWPMLVARWEAVVDAAKATLVRYGSGQPGNRYAVKAAHQLTTLAENTEPWAVVRTVLAMYLLQDQQPRRFVSDAAFDAQLVRRVTRLAPANAGTYWDQSSGRAKRVYRDIPPRAVQALAVPLKEALGAAGVMLAAKEREDAERQRDERQQLAEAIRGLE